MKYTGRVEYVLSGGFKLFTLVLLPYEGGKFPAVIKRSPYVDIQENKSDEEVLEMYLANEEKWLRNGYAVVFQHCRGKGKSEGDCIPFINEREDSLNLYNFVRNSDFYNGELYLWGGSYCCEIHYVTAPFGDDIKGAIFRVKDTDRYNFSYRNENFKISLLGDWYITEMYKKKKFRETSYKKSDYLTLPLSGFSKKIYGEPAEELEEILLHPKREDPYWKTSAGGGDIINAVENVKFPILFETSWYDIFTGGIFDMWNNMSVEARERCALLVSAYDHPDVASSSPIPFEKAARAEKFGAEYDVEWMEFARGKKDAYVPLGKITYYNMFNDEWCSDEFVPSGKTVKIPLGDEKVSYLYNPENPVFFPGGLSSNFGGVCFENKPGEREDIITIYSEEFPEDTFVKGNMKGLLKVSSDCEDTCFYIRLSITKEGGDYGLREDIKNISFHYPDYLPGTEVEIPFEFDEHAFKISKGEKIRIDISSSDAANYVPHTNFKGLFSISDKVRVAKNTINLKESYIEIPVN